MRLIRNEWIPCSRKKLEPILDNMHNDTIDEMKFILSEAPWICTTIDLWSDRKGEFFFFEN